MRDSNVKAGKQFIQLLKWSFTTAENCSDGRSSERWKTFRAMKAIDEATFQKPGFPNKACRLCVLRPRTAAIGQLYEAQDGLRGAQSARGRWARQRDQSSPVVCHRLSWCHQSALRQEADSRQEARPSPATNDGQA